jgi:hypothetical protein
MVGVPGRNNANDAVDGAHSAASKPSMGEVTTIGQDVAKSVFQIHGVDAAGTVVLPKRITAG